MVVNWINFNLDFSLSFYNTVLYIKYWWISYSNITFLARFFFPFWGKPTIFSSLIFDTVIRLFIVINLFYFFHKCCIIPTKNMISVSTWVIFSSLYFLLLFNILNIDLNIIKEVDDKAPRYWNLLPGFALFLIFLIEPLYHHWSYIIKMIHLWPVSFISISNVISTGPWSILYYRLWLYNRLCWHYRRKLFI